MTCRGLCANFASCGVSSLHLTCRKKDEKKHEAEQKKMEQQLKQQCAARTSEEAMRSTMLASLITPFTLKGESMQAIPVISSKGNCEKPFIVKADLGDSWGDSDVPKTLNVWKESFPKQELARTCRCVSAPLKENMGSAAACKAFHTFVENHLDAKFIDSPPTIAAVVDTPNLLGFMSDCVYFFMEPEMGATLRFQVEGSMDVMIARVPRFCFIIPQSQNLKRP